MKIVTRLYFFDQERAPLLADPIVTAELDVTQPVFVDTESAVFQRILELVPLGQGAPVSLEVECTAKELAQVRAYQPLCRKLARETQEDRDLNFERVRNPPEGSAHRVERIVLSRIDLQPNVIGGVDTYSGYEYVLGAGVTQAFRELPGFEPRPVHKPSGATHADAVQLSTSRTMPPVIRDETLVVRNNPSPLPSALAQLGCLTYSSAALDAMADFNRTTEPLTGNWIAGWVVSARLRDLFKERKLKGWAFRPVLEEGSTLHREYVAKWASLRERLGKYGAGRVLR